MILIACVSRQREVHTVKEEVKTKVENSQIENITSEDLNKTEKQNTSVIKSSGLVENSASEKQNENSQRTSKNREFYENGNLKSETEVSESITKEAFKSEINKLISENKQLSFSNENLINQIKTQKEINHKLIAENNSIKKAKDSKLERKSNSWWLYILIYLIGVITIPGIKILFNKKGYDI